MCVNCLVFSTLTLFMPGPQPPADMAAVGVPNAQYSQVNTTSVAKDTQVAIAGMLKNLPNSPDMRVLREGLKSLQVQLAIAKNDAEAQSLIDNRLRSLSDRLSTEPNYDKISEVLMAMLEADDNEPSAKSLGLKMLQSKSYSRNHIKTLDKNWGWLH